MRRLSESRPGEMRPERGLKRRSRGAKALRVGGRAVLWAFVVLVFSRGLAELMRGPTPAQAPAGPARSASASPDTEVQAFAVAFVRTYLSLSPGRERLRERRLAPFFAPGVAEQAIVRGPYHGPESLVEQATVAREVTLGASRVLVTVAASMSDGRTIYLSVPVARDQHGGLAVFDLPSFAAAPPRPGQTAAEELVPLTGGATEEIGDVVGRFMEAYLAGSDSKSLAYYLVPTARVRSIGGGLSLASVQEIAQRPTAPDGELVVTARVRDAISRTVFPQRYRLTVVKRDRWYVAAVAGGPSA